MDNSVIFKPFTTIEQVMEYYPIGTVINVSSKSDNTSITGIVIGYSTEEDGNYVTVGNRSFSVDDLCNNWLINGKPVGIEYIRKEEPKKEEPKKKEIKNLTRDDIRELYRNIVQHGFDPFDDEIIRKDSIRPWDF